MVFTNLVKQYTEEQISQAIRVTQRAKINGTIKTNASDFFVQALKNGYTDQKEQMDKKKLQDEIKQQEIQKWIMELNDLEMEEGAKMREKIRELVAENPNVREQAILSLSENEATKSIVKRASILLNRPLEQEDYRQDKALRELVMLAIVEQNKAAFSAIEEEYLPKIAVIQKRIKENK